VCLTKQGARGKAIVVDLDSTAGEIELIVPLSLKLVVDISSKFDVDVVTVLPEPM